MAPLTEAQRYQIEHDISALGSAFGLLPVFWANGVFLLAGGAVSLAERRVSATKNTTAAVAEQEEEDT